MTVQIFKLKYFWQNRNYHLIKEEAGGYFTDVRLFCKIQIYRKKV